MAARPARRKSVLDRHALPLGLARFGGRPLMASRLTPNELATLRRPEMRQQLECVTCGRAVRVGTDENVGACFYHTAKAGLSHDPETITHHHAAKALAAHITALFGSAQVARSEPFPQLSYIADLAAVSGRGLRLAAEIQECEITRVEYERITNGLEDDGIAVLWLRSLKLLRLTGAKGRPTRRMTLGEVETAILAQGRTLMYLAPDQAVDTSSGAGASSGTSRMVGDGASRLGPAARAASTRVTAGRAGKGPHEQQPVGERIPKLLVVEPHPAAKQLAALGERRIGQVEVALRRYPLSQLRVQQGELCVLTDYDPDLPAFGPPSAAIERKLTAYAKH